MLRFSTQIYLQKNAATSSRTSPSRKKKNPTTPTPFSNLSDVSVRSCFLAQMADKKGIYEGNQSLYKKNTFLWDNSTTRTTACGRELELPASLVISHQSSGYESWPVTTSTTEQMSARTESRLSKKLTTWGLWDAGCKTALAESSNLSEVMWGGFQL